MRYLYNSLENGADIKNWVSSTYKKFNHPKGKIMQYENAEGEEILGTFEFLQDLTRTQVDQVLATAQLPFKCDICQKGFEAAIGLAGHRKTHKNEILEKEVPLDPNIVPLAQGEGNTVIPADAAAMQRMVNNQNTSVRGDETTGGEFLDLGTTVSRKSGL